MYLSAGASKLTNVDAGNPIWVLYKLLSALFWEEFVYCMLALNLLGTFWHQGLKLPVHVLFLYTTNSWAFSCVSEHGFEMTASVLGVGE